MITVVSTSGTAVLASLRRCFEASPHRLILERDPSAVLAVVSDSMSELVLVDATASGAPWRNTVHAVRGQAPYSFIAVFGIGGPGEAVTAFEAGADEYLRFPFDASEFELRLTAIERIMRHVRSSSLVVEEGPGLISLLQVWRDIESKLTAGLADVLSVAAQRVEDPVPLGPTLVSRLKLSLAEPRGTVTLHLVATNAALQGMTQLLLGSPAEEQAVLIDASKEVLNTLGGVFKRGALPVHDFTSGLPELVPLDAMQRSMQVSQFAKSWNIGWGKHVVGIRVKLDCDDVQTVPLHSLGEGMVLADDVRNAVGVLIAPRGLHLTESTIKRLYSVFGGATMVRVSNAA